MKQNLTELVFILDRSGSMAGLEKDTIGGYNAMLEQQRKVDGECVITTVLFDNHDTLLHDRIDIRAVMPITGKDYFVGGSTALLDAIGKTIRKIGTAQKNTAEDYRAEKVMFVIITDGEENASREYSARQVKEMIQRQKGASTGSSSSWGPTLTPWEPPGGSELTLTGQWTMCRTQKARS